MRLEEPLLLQEERLIQFPLQRLLQRQILGAELGAQAVAGFLHDLVEGEDGV